MGNSNGVLEHSKQISDSFRPKSDEYLGELDSRRRPVGPGLVKWVDGDLESFEGKFEKGFPIGQGKLVFRNGDIYIGCFSDGLAEGIGEMEFANGDKYTGSWKKGYRDGEGIYSNSLTGEVYSGAWKNNLFEGKGRIDYNDDYMGRVFYEGMFSKGMKFGLGKCQYISGSIYRGMWSNNKFHGHGELNMSNGNVFRGEFKDGCPINGEFISSNGDVYVGDFDKFQKHGRGVFECKSGAKYDGEWFENQEHGHGIFSFANGESYIGNFQFGRFGEGQGVYWYSDGAVYEGKWENGRHHGLGTLTYANKNVYMGEWNAGIKHGFGRMEYAVDADGKILDPVEFYEGFWENGEPRNKGTSLLLAALKMGALRVQIAADKAKKDIENLKKDKLIEKQLCLCCKDNVIDSIFLNCAQ